MSEIVAATASQVLEGVASAAGQSATQTFEQWAAEEHFRRIVDQTGAELSGKAPVYKWNTDLDQAIEEFDRVVRETGAEGAWRAYKEGGGDVSSNGSATQPPTKPVNPQTAIKKAGAGTATVGGLLSMSLPTWVAAAAPLLGVAVGVGLYELSPELWTKISQKLLPFCYEDSQAMPVVTDEDGNTYIDKEAVEALKEVFDEEGVDPSRSYEVTPRSYQGASYNFVVPSVGNVWNTQTSPQSIIAEVIGDVAFLPIQESGGSVSYQVVGTGHIVIKREGSQDIERDLYPGSISTISGSNPNPSGYPLTDRADVTLDPNEVYNNGQQGTPESHGMPEGTSQWTGRTVDVAALPTTTVYTDPEDETKTRDYIPVALPTQPGQSLNPEENPDPTTNANPEAQISPYIMPTIESNQYPEGSESEGEEGKELDKNAPIPVPFPNPNSNPDTQANPNEQPEEPPQRLVDIIPPIDAGNIPKPNMPGIGDPTNVDGGVGGLVSVYNPTYAELQAFSQWLWVTYADATIDKIWNNPFDGVISLHELYATPNKGARKNIKSGFLVSPVSSITIPNRYSEINCGTAIFPEYWGNYLDYSPYSKALCYLPFIGIVELNVDDIVGHAVNITYRVDSYSGACIALITCAKEGSNGVLYQFSGNCSVQMPIAGGTQAAIKAAQISAGAYQNAYHTAGLAGLMGGMLGGLGSLLSGHVGSAISQAVGGIGSYATNQAFGQANATSQTVSAKSSVQHSGQFGESFGAMGAKRPYMIIKRPVQVVVPNYQNEYGYQAHKYVTIGECEGYLRCRGVHVQSARATDSEKHAIEQMLMEGVYVT